MATSSDALLEEIKQAVSKEATEDDVLDSRERVLQRFFLQEWKLVKFLLHDIVVSPGGADISSAHKIQSIEMLPGVVEKLNELINALG